MVCFRNVESVVATVHCGINYNTVAAKLFTYTGLRRIPGPESPSALKLIHRHPHQFFKLIHLDQQARWCRTLSSYWQRKKGEEPKPRLRKVKTSSTRMSSRAAGNVHPQPHPFALLCVANGLDRLSGQISFSASHPLTEVLNRSSQMSKLCHLATKHFTSQDMVETRLW